MTIQFTAHLKPEVRPAHVDQRMVVSKSGNILAYCDTPEEAERTRAAIESLMGTPRAQVVSSRSLGIQADQVKDAILAVNEEYDAKRKSEVPEAAQDLRPTSSRAFVASSSESPVKPKLDPNTLYEGDNGRITCGKFHCSGMTAHFSGRTIAGQRMRELTAADNAEWVREFGEPMKCEMCKQPFTRESKRVAT